MKKSKIIIPALAMLVMSSAATVTGTVAWFTMNATAKAQGMQVIARTSGSLIIKAVNLSNPILPTASDKGTKVTFTDSAQAFYPSTHSWSKTNFVGSENEATVNSATGLMRVNNGAEINFETGTRMNSGTEIEWAFVTEGDANYYYDYAVYLAGDGMAMNNKNLSITIDNAQDLTANGALSIDFYGATVTTNTVPAAADDAGVFLGTLNLAKVYNDTAYSSAPRASLTKNGVNIPQSSGDDHGAYAIRMRVYYDGALISAGQPNNDYAVYTPCGDEDLALANTLYYSDANGSSIVPREVGDSVKDLYKVATGSSTTCFARSMKVAELAQQSLAVTFTA